MTTADTTRACAMASGKHSALSFDCGLRNLAAALVRVRPGFAFPPEYRTLASADETNEEFKARCLAYFLQTAWQLRDARLIDVSVYLERATRVKNVKRLGLMTEAEALTIALTALETEWFERGAHARPDIIAVEIQHNANADMKAVSLAISVFFMRTMPRATTDYAGVVGGQKLKLCEALGVREGDGTAAKPGKRVSKKALAAAEKEAKAAAQAASARTLAQFLLSSPSAPAAAVVAESAQEVCACIEPFDAPSLDNDDPPLAAEAATEAAAARGSWRGRGRGRGGWGGYARRSTTTTTTPAKIKYEDNKQRTVLTMKRLCTFDAPGMLPDELRPLMADHNVADALLQALWVLWEHWAPRVPARPRKRKLAADE